MHAVPNYLLLRPLVEAFFFLAMTVSSTLPDLARGCVLLAHSEIGGLLLVHLETEC